MITIAKEKYNFQELQEARIPHEKRASKLLESSEIRERMIGYALLTTCYHLCSPYIRDYIKKKWNKEKDLDIFDKAFLNHCRKTFSAGY